MNHTAVACVQRPQPPQMLGNASAWYCRSRIITIITSGTNTRFRSSPARAGISRQHRVACCDNTFRLARSDPRSITRVPCIYRNVSRRIVLLPQNHCPPVRLSRSTALVFLYILNWPPPNRTSSWKRSASSSGITCEQTLRRAVVALMFCNVLVWSTRTRKDAVTPESVLPML